jgi:hypothetical protein
MFVNTLLQGDIGEASAALWFATQGAAIAWPIGHSPDWDFIAEWHDQLYRVQVKTSTYRNPKGNWAVAICTRGGNQSWSGLTKHFSPNRCDYLFVHVGDGRRWLIPASAVEARTAVALGGPKYSQYEVEPGEPLPERTVVDPAA